MAYETAKHLQEHVKTSEPVTISSGDQNQNFQISNRNPLICIVCQNYYIEPCLLSCYHTFCTRCLRGRDMDGKISCPLCGQLTPTRDAAVPPDLLMSQILELANSENPPCSNCDVRDRNNMYYCNTCSQALCNHCRENTHRAKMFSTHEVVHMSKCTKEPKKCPIHGEQYIMFSNSLKTMLCVNCFRDTAADQRSFCIDIDTAYSQASKRLDRAQGGISELQNTIQDGLIMFKSLLDELRQNMESEKHTINTFCQGMQEAIAKTHANMIMEVQRQFETKEKVFRNQLRTLGSILPTLHLHLLLCSTFANVANKFQFLELVYLMFERLNGISQLSHPLRPIQSSTIRTNYRNEFAQSLELWIGKSVLSTVEPDPGYETSIKIQQSQPNISQGNNFVHPSKKQQNALKAKLMEGESPFSNHCRTFESQIKEFCQQLTAVKERLEEIHRDVTILRCENMPPLSIRYECVSRDCVLLDETLEHHLAEMDRLKLIFDTIWEDQLCRIHVEQEIFHSQISDIVLLRNELKHLNTVAQQLEPYIKNLPNRPEDGLGLIGSALTTQQHLQSLLEQIGLLQMENNQLKGECKIHPSSGGATSTSVDGIALGDTIPVREMAKGKNRASSSDLSSTRRAESQTMEQKRNVITQLIEKVNRKKSPTDEQRGQQSCSNISCMKDKEKSKSTTSVQGNLQLQMKDKSIKSVSKSISSAVTIERLESHIKEKIHEMLNRKSSKLFDSLTQDSGILLPGTSSTKSQKTQEDPKYPKAMDIKLDSALQQDFANLVHRKLSKTDLEKLALLSQTTKVLDSKKIGKSCDRINDLKGLKIALSSDIGDSNAGMRTPQHSKYPHKRSKTPDSSQRFRSKTPETHQMGSLRSKSSDKYRSKTPPENISHVAHTSRSCKSFLESDYQHISEATSSLKSDKGKYKANRSSSNSPKASSKKTKVYPFSDGEDAAEFHRRQKSLDRDSRKQSREMIPIDKKDFDRHPCGTLKKKGSHKISQARQNSFESLSTVSLNSRRSSPDADKDLVLIIGTRNESGETTSKVVTSLKKDKHKKFDKANDFSSKQRLWETFPPKKHRNNTSRSYQYCQFADFKDPNQPKPTERKLSLKSTRHEIDEKLRQALSKPPTNQKRSPSSKFPNVLSSQISHPPLKSTPKRSQTQRRQIISERGYCSEYELDFDTDNPDDESLPENLFDFDHDLNLIAFGRRSSKSRPNEPEILVQNSATFSRDYPSHLTTFKGTEPQTNLTTFKGDQTQHFSTFKGELSTFKSDSTKQIATFKQEKPVLSTFKPDTPPVTFTTFKGEPSSSGHAGTFKGESSGGKSFQEYYKGDSSQSLSSFEQRSGTRSSSSSGIPGEGGMKKADSFEGHEEAVRTLVAAVQETRTAAARKTK